VRSLKSYGSVSTPKPAFDSKALIEQCTRQINDEVEINEIVYQMERFDITMSQNSGIGGKTSQRGIIETKGFYGELPDLIEALKQATQLTTQSIKKILSGLDDYLLKDFVKNPQDFIYKVAQVINNQKRKLLVDGIEYEELRGDDGAVLYYDQSLFDDYIQVPETKIVDIVSNKSLYDSIVVDSENERAFTHAFVDNPNIKLFIKLPSRFVVPTPIGSYNPDWAYIKEVINPMNGAVEKTLYFVCETKTGEVGTGELRGKEEDKIGYAKKHFDKTLQERSDTKYKVMSRVDEIEREASTPH
jgi:type III restriction enzyme